MVSANASGTLLLADPKIQGSRRRHIVGEMLSAEGGSG